jgi:crotonobetainyl-CoA:carnitine CoA-transferase CaiB-like acyl-CoA transferase
MEHGMSALSAFRVLELSENVSGEYCGKLLSDFGAEVIKLEKPGDGSPTRRLGPFAERASDGASGERSGLFAYLNTNKSSVELDVSTAAGAATLGKLLTGVDVVIDDHPSGWLKSVGIDAATVEENYPHLVVCSITPYGQDAPEDRMYAEDLNVVHASGWGYHTPSAPDERKPPLKGAGRFFASYESGLEAAMCIVGALYWREESQRGQFIDVSKQAVLASRVDYVLGQLVAGDMDATPARTVYDLWGPATIFPCRNGYVYLWLSERSHWAAMGQLLGNPQWMNSFPERWMELDCTPERVAKCRQEFGAFLKTQERDQVSAQAQKLGLPLVPVHSTRDLPDSAQYVYRGFFAEVNHPVLGRAAYPTVPYKMSETPAHIDAPAPRLGQHTEEKLAALTASDLGRTGGCTRQTRGSLMSNRARGGPLQGVRVIELTRVWAGPFCGKLLAFLGAEVIKVESLGSLDPTRSYNRAKMNHAPGFTAVNPQKLSVQIDIKTKEGRALVLDLLSKADVLLENLRPGAIDRLGLGYDAVKAVKPDIVYVSMGMYGHDGPLSYQTGYAPSFVALGGVTFLVGYEGETPVGMNIRYGDAAFGTAAAFAAVVALMHRRRTGAGQFVDVSAVETMSSMIGDAIMDFTLNGNVRLCDGNRHPEMAPHGVYPCRGGDWISIAVSSDQVWQQLADAMGQPAPGEHPNFKSLADRKTNETELDHLVSQWTAGQDARELAASLQKRGIAAAKSQNSIDLTSDQHLWARGFYREVTDGAGETRPIIGPAWKISHAASIRDAAPQLGEHNAYVLGEILGLSMEEQQRLAEAGITR